MGGDVLRPDSAPALRPDSAPALRPDSAPALRPATEAEIAASLAGLMLQGRRRAAEAEALAAGLLAERLVRHLSLAGFRVMARAGAGSAGDVQAAGPGDVPAAGPGEPQPGPAR
jgi:hypothetical protein